jgi:hypothetical protein
MIFFTSEEPTPMATAALIQSAAVVNQRSGKISFTCGIGP